MKPIIFLLSLLFANALFAQQLKVTGTVIDAASGSPIEFATVAVHEKDSGTMRTGTTTDPEGKFELSVPSQDFLVKISFIGMQQQSIEMPNANNGLINLGRIELAMNGELLDEVVVQGEKSQTQFHLDKRVFNVGTDLSSTGASALEVLNNVPSVTVNIEGQVSLRGSAGVQMLINGKPSVLTSEGGNALGSITADMIDRVEVITNPSAKYEAEGTSGIINIVLKKDEKKGLNGSVTVNTGFPNNHSVGLSINRRTEKFNLFSQLGVGYRTFPSTYEDLNQDKVNQSSLASNGEADKNEEFYNIVLGADYHINPLNIITLSGRFAYEKEAEDGYTNYSFTVPGSTARSWRREETTTATNPKWEYELQYKKDFPNNEDQSLLFSARGSSFGKDKASTFDISGDQQNGVNSQQSNTDFQEIETTFKLDYTHPFSEKITLETGAQYLIEDVSNDFEVNDLVNSEWVPNPTFTNIFDYDQKVLGVYTTLAYEAKKWGVKAGLRLENTDLSTLLRNNDQSNKQQYTNLFPSGHVSYKISEQLSLQAGYSKRIYRPGLWHLNPFFSFRDNFNLATGNPNLLPEFTDSYEVTSIYMLGELSLNAGVYYRHTKDVIERVTTFEDNVTISSPQNIGTNNTTGLEVNAKISPAKFLSLSSDFNLNAFQRKGTLENQSFDFNGNRWSLRLMSKWKLPAKFDVEISGNYNSEYKTVQGTMDDNIAVNLGVRKKLLKNRLIANLSVRDVFASRIRRFTTDQPTFFRSGESFRGRFITFGLSYGFGKGEAMTFSGHKRF